MLVKISFWNSKRLLYKLQKNLRVDTFLAAPHISCFSILSRIADHFWYGNTVRRLCHRLPTLYIRVNAWVVVAICILLAFPTCLLSIAYIDPLNWWWHSVTMTWHNKSRLENYWCQPISKTAAFEYRRLVGYGLQPGTSIPCATTTIFQTTALSLCVRAQWHHWTQQKDSSSYSMDNQDCYFWLQNYINRYRQ